MRISKLVLLSLCVSIIATASAQQGGRGPGQGRSVYTIEQAISDRAQLRTIAFNGLAFITGDFGACTFVPPGKVCDYFGFQYMRDIDQAQAGHNPKFLSRVAGNVLRTLSRDQLQKFQDLADEQAPQYIELAEMRLPVIKAFWLNLQGQVPAGSQGLSESAVKQYIGQLFRKDGEMCLRRAEVMGEVAQSLTADQKKFFASVKFGDFATWPDVDEREEMHKLGPGGSKMRTVAFMTYASEFYSWYAGSLEADTYFCPERHGTYFGGFYMKDMPAMGKKDFSISLSRTSDSGQGFLDTLNEDQRALVVDIVDRQRSVLTEAVALRRSISKELRKCLTGQTPNRDQVLTLCQKYGEADGEMSWLYASAFGKVNKTLTPEQRTKLTEVRNLEGYTSAPYYIYADAARQEPKDMDTRRFFAGAK